MTPPQEQVNVVIPMAGLGQRFTSSGITTPKPLLLHDGKPLYAASTQCVPLHRVKSLVFVTVISAHLHVLTDDIHSRFAHVPHHVVALDSGTAGQAETVLYARDYVDSHLPLLIHNVDTLFQSDFEFLQNGSSWDAVVGVCRGVPGDHWSFVGLDEDERVASVVEKRRISDLVCTGLYAFRSWQLFEDTAHRYLEDIVAANGEAFVAPLIGILAEQGLRVDVDPAAWMMPLGTPEEYMRPRRYGAQP